MQAMDPDNGVQVSPYVMCSSMCDSECPWTCLYMLHVAVVYHVHVCGACDEGCYHRHSHVLLSHACPAVFMLVHMGDHCNQWYMYNYTASIYNVHVQLHVSAEISQTHLY